jgi:hypothetical protein
MEPEQEFLEDFGARRLADSAVIALLERARAAGDVDLRRLAKEVQMWRNVAPLLLDRLVPAGAPIDENDAMLKLARFVIRGEGSVLANRALQRTLALPRFSRAGSRR